MQSTLYAIARPSVRLSVSSTDGSVKNARIMQLSLQSSPIPLVFAV